MFPGLFPFLVGLIVGGVIVFLFLRSQNSNEQNVIEPKEPPSSPKPDAKRDATTKVEKKRPEKGKKDEEPVVDPVKVKEHMKAEQDCAGCPLECTDHTSYPKSVLTKIDWTSELYGTVKAHEKHFMLCFGTDPMKWKKEINDESDYVSAFSQATEKFKKVKSRVTLVDISTPGVENIEEEGCDIIVLPDLLKYKKIKKEQIVAFLEAVLVQKSIFSDVASNKLEKKSYVFICAHKLRDKRCGISGPILVEEFHKYLKEHHLEKEIEVASISHIGGHAWAGNVIIYPEGTWYGRVMPCHVHAIVDTHIVKKQILKPLLRGSIEIEKEHKEKEPQKE